MSAPFFVEIPGIGSFRDPPTLGSTSSSHSERIEFFRDRNEVLIRSRRNQSAAEFLARNQIDQPTPRRLLADRLGVVVDRLSEARVPEGFEFEIPLTPQDLVTGRSEDTR